jgi:Skp family chaperone for outer membrane proteins
MKGCIAAVLVLFLASTAWAEQQIKIGYVDLQRALNESDGGKKAKEEFKKQVDKLQGELKKQKDDLESMKEQLETFRASSRRRRGSLNGRTRTRRRSCNARITSSRPRFSRGCTR